MNDKLDLEVTIKPALTVERIREELADMVGLQLNAETKDEIFRRLNAIGLFDFSVEAKPTCTDERPCVNCFSGQGECLDTAGKVNPGTSRALLDVLAERLRQVGSEGWTEAHDDHHSGGELAVAAASYAMPVSANPEYNDRPPFYWPWDPEWWKPADARRNLVKSGALILAELERLDRLSAAVTAEADDLTQFLEGTDFDAAEKVASQKADAKPLPTAGEDDCDGCRI